MRNHDTLPIAAILGLLLGGVFTLVPAPAEAAPYGMTCDYTTLRTGRRLDGSGSTVCRWKTTVSSENVILEVSNSALSLDFYSQVNQVIYPVTGGAGSRLVTAYSGRTGGAQVCAYNLARTVKTCATINVVN